MNAAWRNIRLQRCASVLAACCTAGTPEQRLSCYISISNSNLDDRDSGSILFVTPAERPKIRLTEPNCRSTASEAIIVLLFLE